MPDPSTYRPATGTIPVDPGVYKFRDPRGTVIYVGKAKSLRQRLNSYFADLSALHPRTRQMVTTAASVEWTIVTTEVEALQLEYNWIKEFDPRFNVRYRDDKTYPVAGGHAVRGVPAAAGHARREAQGGALLRTVRARLGHSRDARPAAAGLSGPHLLAPECSNAPVRSAVPACSATSASAAHPASARSRADEHRADRQRLLRLHGRQDRPADAAPRAVDAPAPAPTSSSSGPPGCATTSRHCGGRWRSKPSCSATAPTPTWSPSLRTTSKRPSRSFMSVADGSEVSAAGLYRQGRGDQYPGSGRELLGSVLRPATMTTPSRPAASRARSWCRNCPTTSTSSTDWL